MKKKLMTTLLYVLLFSCISMAQNRPNIVLIMADDLGGRDLPLCRSSVGRCDRQVVPGW